MSNVSGSILFYSSQIRHYAKIDPIFPTHLIFPAMEPHFSVLEVMQTLKQKEQVEVHHSTYLHGFMNPGALEQLTAKGVSVHLNTRLVKEGAIYRSMNTQETFKADLVYECVGMSPNTEFLKTELPGVLDKMGLIKVDEYMRVRGYSNLYAIDDCSTMDENKHGYIANVQGGILASVIINQAKGKRLSLIKHLVMPLLRRPVQRQV
ncbi:FAD-dependent oxidoreductase [Microbulbifer sp. SSSA008]|uniref:FAD-dependent oxidoreductase n=1 Tax=Microbulbifer sp. SSSA008 TaxID=3243380 RepID=UPI00403A61D4